MTHSSLNTTNRGGGGGGLKNEYNILKKATNYLLHMMVYYS